MVKVSFKGPLKKSIGFEEVEIEGGTLDEVLKQLSEKLNVEFVKTGNSIKLSLDVDGSKVKFTVSLFHDGKNVLREGIEKIESGKLEIITPLGGG